MRVRVPPPALARSPRKDAIQTFVAVEVWYRAHPWGPSGGHKHDASRAPQRCRIQGRSRLSRVVTSVRDATDVPKSEGGQTHHRSPSLPGRRTLRAPWLVGQSALVPERLTIDSPLGARRRAIRRTRITSPRTTRRARRSSSTATVGARNSLRAPQHAGFDARLGAEPRGTSLGSGDCRARPGEKGCRPPSF